MLLKIKRRGAKGIFQVTGTVAGVRVRQSLSVDTKEDAQVRANQIERQILDEAIHGKRATVTFAKAVNLYRQKGGSPRFLTPLLVHFGNKFLSTITDADLCTFISLQYPNAKPQTIIRQVYTPMISVWNVARELKLMGAHEFMAPEKPKRVAIEFKRDDQLAVILATATEEERALLLFLSFAGGPRASEVCRVMDDHVDWLARTVLFPKTKGEPRQVPLPPLVYEALLPLKGRNPLFGCKDRWALNRAITRACKRAGVPRITSHKIGRHSFAARLLGQGIKGGLKGLQQAGGWSEASIPMLASFYGHLEQSVVDDHVRNSDTNLAQLLEGGDKTSEKQRIKRA
jgi:integrase